MVSFDLLRRIRANVLTVTYGRRGASFRRGGHRGSYHRQLRPDHCDLGAERERERSGSGLRAAIEGNSVRVAAPGVLIARVTKENCFVAGSRTV
jgi:hypothetical protein